jgi:hypothetical protein
MASGDTDLAAQLLAEAPVKTPHSSYKQKRVRQLLDAYLEHGTRIAPAGTLAYTLYTVVPNPGRSLTRSWQEVEREWIILKLALETLGEVGVVCSFLGLETHSPESKKGKGKPAAKKARGTAPGSTEGEDEEGEDLEQEGRDTPAPPAPHGSSESGGEPARLHLQALKPHFHALLVHDLTDLGLRDPGFLNRLLAEKDRVADEAAGSPPRFQDVRADPVSLRKHGPTNSICYIFKASGDKLTEFLAKKFCPSWTRPLVTLVYPASSKLWTRSSMQQMIRLCNLYDPTLQLVTNTAALPAPGAWGQEEYVNESVTLPAKKLQVARRIGRWLEEQKIYYCDGHFVDLQPGTRAVARLRYKSLEPLLQDLIRLPAFQNDLWRYAPEFLKMPLWALTSAFPVRTVGYSDFELEDCFVHHGRRDPSPEDMGYTICAALPPGTFAAARVPLRRDQVRMTGLYTRQPVVPDIRTYCPKWWGVIANAWPMMDQPYNLLSHLEHRRNVERLLNLLAHSLCRQNFKDPVPFLVGESNTGKSSLVEPMYRLYGDSLKAIVQGSSFPLEKLPYARYVVFEEFRLNTLPSNTLFQLTEHGLVTCDVKHKPAVEVYCDFGMVACSNIRPVYTERTQALQAPLDNRFEYFHFAHPIPNPDKAARKIISDVETPYALLFMIMVYHGKSEL